MANYYEARVCQDCINIGVIDAMIGTMDKANSFIHHYKKVKIKRLPKTIVLGTLSALLSNYPKTNYFHPFIQS